MRNLEERMAEIGRRSEKILAQRKKRRRRILTVCIPFVLCLGIYAVSQLPGGTKKAKLAQMDQASADAAIGSVCEIQVSGMGTSQSYTDAEQIQLFCDRLDTFTPPAYGLSTPEAAPEDKSHEPELKEESEAAMDYYTGSISANQASSEYTITVTMDDGSVTKYRLTGSTLRNLTTGQAYLLTQSQLEELLQLLTE